MIKFKAVLRRQWWVLVVLTVLGVVAGLVSAMLRSDEGDTIYRSEQVVVAARASDSPAFVPQDALKVTRGAVAIDAAERLGDRRRPDRFVRKIDVEADEKSNSITISATDPDPATAVRIVEAFSTAFLQRINAELRSEDQRQLNELRQRVDAASAALRSFDAQNPAIAQPGAVVENTPENQALVAERRRLIEALDSDQRAFDDAQLKFSQRTPYSTLGPEPAKVDDSQLLAVPTSPPVRGALLGLLGLLLGAGLVLAIERAAQRIDTREELAEAFPYPVLAEVGDLPESRRPHHPDGRVRLDGLWAEQYRRLRSAIQYVQHAGLRPPAPERNGSSPDPPQARQPKVFLITSVLPGDGKSTTVALAALALAEVGVETLAVSADFRRPTLDRLLGVGPGPTIGDLASPPTGRPPVIRVAQPTPVPGVWLAPSGPPSLEVGTRLDLARELAVEAAARGGTVLLDSTPLQVANDAIDLLPVVDEVILVVRAGKITRRRLAHALDLLLQHGAPVMGAVLIGTIGLREQLGYYDSYYGPPKAATGPAPIPVAAPAAQAAQYTS